VGDGAFRDNITYVLWGSAGEIRPILVVEMWDSKAEFYQITTQYASKSEYIKSTNFKINDWTKAGFDKPSYPDTGVLVRFSLSSLKGEEPRGKLAPEDELKLLKFLKKQ